MKNNFIEVITQNKIINLFVDLAILTILIFSTWSDFHSHLITDKNYLVSFLMFQIVFVIGALSTKNLKRLQNNITSLNIYIWMYRFFLIIFIFFQNENVYGFVLWLAYLIQITITSINFKMLIISRNAKKN